MSTETMIIGEPDRVTALVETALGHARALSQMMPGDVLPVLSPPRRAFAEHLAGRLVRADVFDADILRDLETFEKQLSEMIEAGTSRGWEPNPDDIPGGQETAYYDEAARQLRMPRHWLRQLCLTIAAVLNAVAAQRVAMHLLSL